MGLSRPATHPGRSRRGPRPSKTNIFFIKIRLYVFGFVHTGYFRAFSRVLISSALFAGLPSSPLEFSSDRDVSFSEAAGSSGGLHDESNAVEGLYLPTIA
ncbi:hypothetical protein Hanom_Chr03g00178721 [Helianthus anomalus]